MYYTKSHAQFYYAFDSGNKEVNMCEGDMAFYWMKQEELKGQRLLVVGEGPKFVANGSTLHRLEMHEVLAQVKMYGPLEKAYFNYGE